LPLCATQKESEKPGPVSDVPIAPERNPHRTRTNLTVSERYLIVAKREIQASDKRDFVVYHIFHAAAGPAALVETGETTRAFNRSVDRFLRDLVQDYFFNPAGLFGR
jgi:hypothetical protein